MPIRCRTVYTYDGTELNEDHVLAGEPEFEIHATVYPGEEPSWDNPGSPGEIEISQVYHDCGTNEAAIKSFLAEYWMNHKIRGAVNDQIWEAAAECARERQEDW
jgi:hypothetical protein